MFKEIKHSERRRSGRKNLSQDLEHLPASAALAYNIKDTDYVSIICGPIDKLAEAFAQLDKDEQSRRQNNLPSSVPENIEDLKRVPQLSTSSLSTADRRIVRTDDMNRIIKKVAKSRAPRLSIEA